MRIHKLTEHGMRAALMGLGLSFKDRAISDCDFFNSDRMTSLSKRAVTLAPLDKGHNKLLESLQVWIDIEAPRSWWQEFDTYRVGMTKQSESTMHTLHKRPTTLEDYELGTHSSVVDAFNKILSEHTENFTKRLNPESLCIVKHNLPEGFLQRRICSTNYKVLRHIALQRKDHRYKLWRFFLEALWKQLMYTELLPELD